MKPKKTAFSYFVNTLFLLGILFILVCGVGNLGTGQEYPFVRKGVFFVLFLCLWLGLNTASAALAWLQPEYPTRVFQRRKTIAEVLFGTAVLIAAAALRVAAIRNMPMQPASDYRTYYEIADLLNRGTIASEGAGYCDYIALFPHVYGYPRALADLFHIFGTRVAVAQYFNVVMAVGSVLLCWLIARLASGRAAGLTALLLAAFWPSQVMFVTMAASEFLFSFLMLLGVYLYLLSLKYCTAEMKHPLAGVFLLIAVGLILGWCASVRPMALLVIITIILCTFRLRLFLPAEKAERPSISLMILSRGWLRCLVIILCYSLVTGANSMTIAQTIERAPAGGTASFGYNLLVGLNTESQGGWSAEDADLLDAEYARTGDATQAHLTCRDLALQRLTRDGRSIFNLVLEKYSLLWGNDDYGGTWNLTLMEEQGELTPERRDFILGTRDYFNIFYLLAAAFAGIAGIFLWKKGNDYEYVFILIFVGTVGMHMFVESQNRYHFHALYLFAILAACAVSEISRMNHAKVQKLMEERRALRLRDFEKQQQLRKMHADDQDLTERRKAAMQSQFDMRDALDKDLIRVSVSKTYDRRDEEPEDEA